jgi:hypothetical protein
MDDAGVTDVESARGGKFLDSIEISARVRVISI